jgi:DNA repair protein SbcD/Mre11
MRLIHTADVHLDASFAGAGMPPGLGNRRRQSLRDVFQSILDRAREWPADAVLVAGDLFDHDRVSRDTVAFLRESFQAIAPIPVFIAPGNHDPFVSGSPYATEDWPANVHIFNRPFWTSYALDNLPLTVHGFAFDGPDISANPFGTLAAPEDDRIHVAVAHGSERGSQPPGKMSYAPFLAQEASVPGLRYLALGHFHDVKRIPGDYETVMYYAGAPEGHDFSETGPHHFLEIEIADAGQVQVLPANSSRAVYEIKSVDCSALTNSNQLVDLLRGFAVQPGPDQLLRVLLWGEIQPGIQAVLPVVHDAVAEVFAFLDLVDETHPLDDYAALAKTDTTMGVFVQQITRAIEDAPSPEQRAMLERARQAGLAAYRGRDLPIRGLEGDPA